MKKIMLNDRYGLTETVLEGRKTMTRRIIKCPKKAFSFTVGRSTGGGRLLSFCDVKGFPIGEIWPKYQVGEVVAIAQAYKELDKILADREWKRTDDKLDNYYRARQFGRVSDTDTGWNNKMFVSADLMPHHIKITSVEVERLQDISDKDCLKEGIDKAYMGYYVNGLRTRDWEKESHVEKDGKTYKLFPTPQDAFAALIDKISDKGTWQSNPWVFCYEFELVD